MPKQIRHWMGLVWKKCPVSNEETELSCFNVIWAMELGAKTI
jgi:hypothetical protein